MTEDASSPAGPSSRDKRLADRAAILERVRRLLIEQLRIRRQPDEIDPDCPLFATGLGLDSVDAVELVVALESEFGVVLPDGPQARRSLRTANTLVDLIVAHQGGAAAASPPPSDAAAAPAAPAGAMSDAGIGAVADAGDDPGFGAAIDAIRRGTAWSRMDHVVHLRIAGPDAFALLDRAVAADLTLRDGQLLHSLLLGEDGGILADAQLTRVDEDFLLSAEGLPAPALTELLASALPGADVTITALDEEHEAIALHGPYCWELLGELVGPEVIGLPYGALFEVDGWLGLRSGKTGEYGYDLLLPRARAAEAHARLREVGARFGLVEAGLGALDQCALENGFFCVRHRALAQCTPMELQLQWRVSRRKDYRGAAALAARRAAGTARRCVYLAGASDARFDEGSAVLDGERQVGEVLVAAPSRTLGRRIGVALVDAALAWPGVDLACDDGRGGRAMVSTRGAILLANRSLFVSPQRHSYASRAEDEAELPPLVEW